jgi:Zn-dependent peptidase ImmA (M78 family)
MNQAFRLKMAKQKAEALLTEKGIQTLRVDPIAIAREHDIEVMAKPDAEAGVSGMLLRHGNNFGILYATHLQNAGFERFSIGHELGHYFLEGHVDHVLPKDGIHVSQAGFVSGDPYEQEADSFSAGLLMPSGPFKRELNRRTANLSTIKALADQCETSLSATAIRCTELTSDALAVIVSTGSKIDYCMLSEAMKSLPGLSWLRKGSPVPQNTGTAQFNRDYVDGNHPESRSEEIAVANWLGGMSRERVLEEIVGLGRYGKTLTILSSERIGQERDDSEDESEDDLTERWTPRFRK